MAVEVEGAPYSIKCLRRPIMESKITVPKDLCRGENVENYSACSGESFKEAMKQFKDFNKVLMIVIDSSNELFTFVKKHLNKDFVEYRSWSTGNETKATDWLANKSKKKYLITDEWAVAGFEFDTVILVTHSNQQSKELSTVIQRARAKLIVISVELLVKPSLLSRVNSLFKLAENDDSDSNSDESVRSAFLSALSVSSASSMRSRSPRNSTSMKSFDRSLKTQSLHSEHSTATLTPESSQDNQRSTISFPIQTNTTQNEYVTIR